jgi:hypothetical protein
MIGLHEALLKRSIHLYIHLGNHDKTVTQSDKMLLEEVIANFLFMRHEPDIKRKNLRDTQRAKWCHNSHKLKKKNMVYTNRQQCDPINLISLKFTGDTHTSSRLSLGPTQPPIQCVQGTLSPEVKRPWREADSSPPTSVEVKKRGSILLLPLKPSWRSA